MMWLELSAFALLASLIVFFADDIAKFCKKFKIPLFNHPLARHALYLIVLSTMIVLFGDSFVQALYYLLLSYQGLVSALVSMMGESARWVLLARVLVLIGLSFIPPLILAGAYWLMWQKWSPYFIHTVWITWIIFSVGIQVLWSYQIQ